MKIRSLKYKNHIKEWNYDEIKFDDLTLLVGISGVGKTQILKSIIELKRIASGEKSNGTEWEVIFESGSKEIFKWIGRFGVIEKENSIAFIYDENEEIESNHDKPKILYEKLFKDEKLIVDRDESNTFFKGEKMPKFDASESILKILKEEDVIKPAYESFQKIIYRDHTTNEAARIINSSDFIDKLKRKISNLSDLRNTNLDTFNKFLLSVSIAPDIFEEIKEKFIDIFHQVEDVSVERTTDGSFPFPITLIKIKEKNVKQWIAQDKISSGMIRTLRHICEMFLWADGTLILIDEFENSLGLNCINVLSHDLLNESGRLQFIVTSHHPYVIDKIPHTHWKIVTREGGKIHVFGTETFELEKSSHENFIKLVNLPQYIEGIGFKN